MDIDIKDISPETHVCTAIRRGDLVVFRCPICPEYQRTINLTNGRTRVKGATGALHTGSGGKAENLKGLTGNLNDN